MNEETIIQGQTMTNGNENPQIEQSKSSTWKQVSIGGVAGILIGAGAMYAGEAYAAEKEETTAEDVIAQDGEKPEGVKIAEVNDNMSFKEAFEAAREQVGTGGVFRWHGGIYNTYTEDEWNGMSDAEKDNFAEMVKPEVSAADIDTSQITETTPDVHVHVHVHETSQDSHAVSTSDDVRVEDSPAAVQTQDTDDVRIVAYGNVQGHDAVAYDLDGDGQADVAVIDVDDSHSLSAPDVVVDTAGNMATLGDLAEMAQDPTIDPNLQTVSYDNPDVAPDMPDYSNDADVDVLV